MQPKKNTSIFSPSSKTAVQIIKPVLGHPAKGGQEQNRGRRFSTTEGVDRSNFNETARIDSVAREEVEHIEIRNLTVAIGSQNNFGNTGPNVTKMTQNRAAMAHPVRTAAGGRNNTSNVSTMMAGVKSSGTDHQDQPLSPMFLSMQSGSLLNSKKVNVVINHTQKKNNSLRKSFQQNTKAKRNEPLLCTGLNTSTLAKQSDAASPKANTKKSPKNKMVKSPKNSTRDTQRVQQTNKEPVSIKVANGAFNYDGSGFMTKGIELHILDQNKGRGTGLSQIETTEEMNSVFTAGQSDAPDSKGERFSYRGSINIQQNRAELARKSLFLGANGVMYLEDSAGTTSQHRERSQKSKYKTQGPWNKAQQVKTPKNMHISTFGNGVRNEIKTSQSPMRQNIAAPFFSVRNGALLRGSIATKGSTRQNQEQLLNNTVRSYAGGFGKAGMVFKNSAIGQQVNLKSPKNQQQEALGSFQLMGQAAPLNSLYNPTSESQLALEQEQKRLNEVQIDITQGLYLPLDDVFSQELKPASGYGNSTSSRMNSRSPVAVDEHTYQQFAAQLPSKVLNGGASLQDSIASKNAEEINQLMHEGSLEVKGSKIADVFIESSVASSGRQPVFSTTQRSAEPKSLNDSVCIAEEEITEIRPPSTKHLSNDLKQSPVIYDQNSQDGSPIKMEGSVMEKAHKKRQNIQSREETIGRQKVIAVTPEKHYAKVGTPDLGSSRKKHSIAGMGIKIPMTRDSVETKLRDSAHQETPGPISEIPTHTRILLSHRSAQQKSDDKSAVHSMEITEDAPGHSEDKSSDDQVSIDEMLAHNIPFGLGLDAEGYSTLMSKMDPQRPSMKLYLALGEQFTQELGNLVLESEVAKKALDFLKIMEELKLQDYNQPKNDDLRARDLANKVIRDVTLAQKRRSENPGHRAKVDFNELLDFQQRKDIKFLIPAPREIIKFKSKSEEERFMRVAQRVWMIYDQSSAQVEYTYQRLFKFICEVVEPHEFRRLSFYHINRLIQKILHLKVLAEERCYIKNPLTVKEFIYKSLDIMYLRSQLSDDQLNFVLKTHEPVSIWHKVDQDVDINTLKNPYNCGSQPEIAKGNDDRTYQLKRYIKKNIYDTAPETDNNYLIEKSFYKTSQKDGVQAPILTRLLSKTKQLDINREVLDKESNMRRNKLMIEHIVNERSKDAYEVQLLSELQEEIREKKKLHSGPHLLKVASAVSQSPLINDYLQQQ